MSDPRYTEAALPSAEATRPDVATLRDRGQAYDSRTGAPIVALPATMKPCPAKWDGERTHPHECECLGTGQVAVRRPAGEGVDPADDSLDATLDAIAERDENSVDPYLGASVTDLMQPAVRVEGHGGGGGRKKKSATGGGGHSLAAERSAIDGRLERTGRPPRFRETRPERVRTTIAPETANIMAENKSDLALLADELLAKPEVQAVLAEVKAEAEQAGKGAA